MLWNDDYLHQIEGDFGDKTAQLVAQSHQTAINTLEQVSPEEQGYLCTQYPPSFEEAAPASAKSHVYAMLTSAWRVLSEGGWSNNKCWALPHIFWLLSADHQLRGH